MTQLPPEQRASRERTGLDWDAILAGDEASAGATGGRSADAASAGGTRGGARDAGWVNDPFAAQPDEAGRPASAPVAPRSNDPFAANDEVPLTRRERRELEERQALLETEPATGPSEAQRPSRAERRQAAGYDDHDTPNRPKRRGAWGCLIALLIVVALGVGAFFFLQGPISAVVERFQPAADYEGSGTGEVTFMIHEGDDGSSIAENLYDEGVVASSKAFYDVLVDQDPEPAFYPGAYRLAEKMSAQSALDALLDPANKLENTFVIPEGTATADALPSISEGTGVPLEELQAAAAESPQSYGLPAEAKSLEGFLFPATYTLDPGLDARGVLQTLVDRQFQALDEAGVAPADRWRTIVLASLIQREAGLRDDYYKVSRVFQNRLDPAQWESGLLQSDATVAYGTGNTHRVATTDAEREDASNPYNTYVHPGLPVGPISNPGDLAIDAALHPADGTWLFFVTWNLDTGETIFSTTVEEHDAAVAKWLAWMDEHPEYQ
ncbi:endolytic transglycosylase MltG [Agromyces mediolanus]|uniref:endolytic transglycosylase MltG n=1 Tax=Agromyces mediolanus TaxID=41986 RepID=UPI0038379589